VAAGPEAGDNSIRLVHPGAADQFEEGRPERGRPRPQDAQSNSSLSQFLGLRYPPWWP
jgi:hypothetical protein